MTISNTIRKSYDMAIYDYENYPWMVDVNIEMSLIINGDKVELRVDGIYPDGEAKWENEAALSMVSENLDEIKMDWFDSIFGLYGEEVEEKIEEYIKANL